MILNATKALSFQLYFICHGIIIIFKILVPMYIASDMEPAVSLKFPFLQALRWSCSIGEAVTLCRILFATDQTPSTDFTQLTFGHGS